MRTLLSAAICLIGLSLSGQSLERVKRDVAVLTDSAMHGRGYVHEGQVRAAEFLAERFAEIGIKPLNGSYFQTFTFEVNVYEAPVELRVGKKDLRAGEDFITDPSSGTSEGTYKVQRFDSTHFSSDAPLGLRRGRVPLVFTEGIRSPEQVSALHDFEKEAAAHVPVIRVVPDKLTWSVGQRKHREAIAEVRAAVFPATAKPVWEKVKKISLSIKPEMRTVSVANLIGKIPGRRSDSCFVITAHYDHLGRMGDALFPGANDNASGTAAMLDLAAYFAENPPPFDMYFIAFAAEEAGLLGSRYFVQNPRFDLSKIAFLINLDLAGSAAKGITVVNGRAHKDRMAQMAAINTESNYVPKIKLRGNAPNSDHYFFAEAGVPAVFIYTEGHITAYHDVHDTADAADWTGYAGYFNLLRTFIETF